MSEQQKIKGTWLDDPSHFRQSSRRSFLYSGLVGGLGLTLGDFFALKAQAGTAPVGAGAKFGQAKSIIHIFLPGGMAAQETFDPKLYAPIEYRGPLGSIGTKIPGIRFGETMKHTAQIADKITVIRSMTHGEAAHERGTHNMFTGYRPSPAIQYPSMGSVVSHELGSRKSLPPYVSIPRVPNEFAGSGYLSSAYGPFSLGSDPARGDFKVQDLALPEGITAERFEKRKSLLASVDAHFKSMENADGIDAMDSFYQDAYSLISSPAAREAFDLAKEPGKLRDEYGRNEAGQRMLLARRLVESGVRFVSLTAGGWDHHQNIKDAIGKNLPPVDQAFSTLIRDLEQRGMLDETLVMLTTEFGRTPKINKDGGRDHFPKVFSVAMAGGGFQKGLVYGQSDSTSTGVEEDPLSVEDLAHTVYHQLGIEAEKRLMAPGNRPIDIVRNGKVVDALLG